MAGEQIRLLVVEDVPQVASHIRSLLAAQSQIKMLDVVTAGDRAVASVAEMRPDVVIVDALLQGRVSGQQVAQQIRQAEPQVGIIMLTVPQNPISENTERGIDAVLKMPFTGFDLTTMVRKVGETRALESARSGSLVVTLFSPKGGVGRTTLAYNLAVALGQDHRVCLIDGSLQFSDLRGLLRVPAVAPSIVNLPTDRIRDQDLAEVTWRDPSGIDILLAPPRIEMAEMVTTRDIEKVLSLLRQLYEFVIIDTRAALSEDVLVFLDSADLILQVLTYDSMAIRALAMSAETFAAIGYPPSKLATVLNRADASGGFEKADVEQALGSRIDFEIVSDGNLVLASNNDGIGLRDVQPGRADLQGRATHRRIAGRTPPRAVAGGARRVAEPFLSRSVPSAGDPRPIGVFDSGVGGLTVLAELNRRLPAESTVYLGDNGRAPYGPRPAEEVRRFTAEAVDWLLRQDVKLLVLACNTATARALPLVRAQSSVPVLGVVRPGAVAATAATRSHRVGVIATAGTVESGAYPAAIVEADAATHVAQLACPELVPMVEAGIVDGRRAESVLRAYLEPLLAAEPGMDTLLLGCTHYPLLREVDRADRGRGGGRRRLRVHHGPRHRGPARRARLAGAGGIDARPPGGDDRIGRCLRRGRPAPLRGSAAAGRIGRDRAGRARSRRLRSMANHTARLGAGIVVGGLLAFGASVASREIMRRAGTTLIDWEAVREIAHRRLGSAAAPMPARQRAEAEDVLPHHPAEDRADRGRGDRLAAAGGARDSGRRRPA